jgi:glucose-6-phosphate 1-epimerase
LPDLDPTEWHEFIAIETVNAAANAITLASGAAHVMQARVSVETVTA